MQFRQGNIHFFVKNKRKEHIASRHVIIDRNGDVLGDYGCLFGCTCVYLANEYEIYLDAHRLIVKDLFSGDVHVIMEMHAVNRIYGFPVGTDVHIYGMYEGKSYLYVYKHGSKGRMRREWIGKGRVVKTIVDDDIVYIILRKRAKDGYTTYDIYRRFEGSTRIVKTIMLKTSLRFNIFFEHSAATVFTDWDFYCYKFNLESSGR